METMPKTFAVLMVEGGHWVPFVEGAFDRVHGVMLEDGNIWDAMNGWREMKGDVEFLRKIFERDAKRVNGCD